MIKISGDHFVDEWGRQVILHGVNMVCKDKSRKYIGDWSDEDFSKLRHWGLNVIRFGVIWDGLEPEPGIFNDSYIEELRHMIQAASQYDLMIILDMHQDLFSSQFGDGAPSWATITDGKKYEPGHVWSDAYLFNSAVHKAFDHFWNNTPAPDGAGIQDHFIKAWGYLIQKLHKEPNIIGYDLLNEPFIGSPVLDVNEKMFSKYAEIYSEKHGEVDIEELFQAWSDPLNKHDYLSLLENVDAFERVVDSPSPILQSFEKNDLTNFYCKVATEIRKIDKKRILFLETNYFSNLGTRSMIQPVVNTIGNRDLQQAYAPHAYDIVTDTDLSHTANDRRLEFIFQRHEETRQRLAMPMLIGEWGAFYDSNSTGHVSVYVQRMMENLLCSDTYWHYTPNMDKSLSTLGVRRGYPMAVAGKLLQYRYEHAVGTFQMKWEEISDNNALSIIYLPDISKLEDNQVTLSPPNSSYNVLPIDGSNAGLLEIPTIMNGIRSLVIITS